MVSCKRQIKIFPPIKTALQASLKKVHFWNWKIFFFWGGGERKGVDGKGKIFFFPISIWMRVSGKKKETGSTLLWEMKTSLFFSFIFFFLSKSSNVWVSQTKCESLVKTFFLLWERERERKKMSSSFWWQFIFIPHQQFFFGLVYQLLKNVVPLPPKKPPRKCIFFLSVEAPRTKGPSHFHRQ